MYTSMERGMTKVGWYMLVREVAYAAMALSSSATAECARWPRPKWYILRFAQNDSELNVGAECCAAFRLG